jgi:Ca2+-binding EF-hand superfamily protein
LIAVFVCLAIGRLAIRDREWARGEPPSSVGAPGDTLELALVDEGRSDRVALRVEVNGRALSEVWNEAFRTLFAFYDRDRSQTLSKKEAKRLPSAIRVRQLSWGYFFAGGDEPIDWRELSGDREVDEIGFESMTAYYRTRGIGSAALSAGREPEPTPADEALRKTLDADGNGRLTEREFSAARKAFRRLDLNEDDVLAADELAPGIPYPAAQGGTLWFSSGMATMGEPRRPQFPLAPLSARPTTHGADSDRSSLRSASARQDSPQLELIVRLDLTHVENSELQWRLPGGAAQTATHGQLARIVVGSVVLAVRLGGVERVNELKAACDIARQRFGDADQNADGRLTRAEAMKLPYPPLAAQFDLVDLDGDGTIEREDWNAWLDLKQRLLAGQAIAAAIDHRRGLLEFLDLDDDGRLSQRELRTAWARLESAGCTVDGAVVPEKLPRQIALRVGIGKQNWSTPEVAPQGPAWFWAMDRNRDGDVSRDEFLGPADEFERLDADGDGLAQLSEAEAAAGELGAKR